MLTIGQLASYASTTVRAVRHYHHIGLLAEPHRDFSGYRRYGAHDVVSLIRIRTLAEAGVPLSRVGELLDADAAEFAGAAGEIDQRLQMEIGQLQDTRRRVAQLARGQNPAVPQEVTAYLDRLRELGISELVVEAEQRGYILLTARWPDRIHDWMPAKHAQLKDPRMIRLYQIITDIFDSGTDQADSRLGEVVDIIAELNEEAYSSGAAGFTDVEQDDPMLDLIDALGLEADPRFQRLLDLLRERGWDGLARLRKFTD